MKDKITLAYQSYGSSILIFVTAPTDADAEGKYLSLYNWNATSSEPERVGDGIISCWSTIARLKKYLFNQRINQLLDAGADKTMKGKKNGVRDEASRLAAEDFANITRETYRSINSDTEAHVFGQISAERPDDDLKDYFVTKGLQAR